jgi:multisubunit Na+/H+ antiporter MnhB subunit
MPGGLTVVLAIVIICAVMSTREGRREARARMRRFNKWLIGPVILLWAFILWGMFGPR